MDAGEDGDCGRGCTMTRTCGNCQRGKFQEGWPIGFCQMAERLRDLFDAPRPPCLKVKPSFVERTANAEDCGLWQKLTTPNTHRGNPDSKTGGDSTSPVKEKRGRVAATKGR